MARGEAYSWRGGTIQKGVKGQFQGNQKLTKKQKLFCAKLARYGGNVAASSRAVGIKTTTGYGWARSPKIQEEVQQRRNALINSDLGSLALEQMRDLMQEPNPANVRFQASKWILEQAGHTADSQKDPANQRLNGDMPLSEMTLEELEAYISAGNAALQMLDDKRNSPKDVGPITIEQDPADSQRGHRSAPSSAPTDSGDDLF